MTESKVIHWVQVMKISIVMTSEKGSYVTYGDIVWLYNRTRRHCSSLKLQEAWDELYNIGLTT